jgi:hypothetical protein
MYHLDNNPSIRAFMPTLMLGVEICICKYKLTPSSFNDLIIIN